MHEYGKCNSSTATEGDQREVEAEEKSGEERRFRLFQMKFQKIEKNLNLEMQLDELRDAYMTLEQNLSGDDKSYKQKLEVLESSNREISNMY